ncbi:MAG TPA: PmeII family type II restriction endonuclease [Anaerolineae bacterium]|nr:PmeII family type II restriction endonuclease [Anaerolineae bacterium]HNU02921.1 PmeII family type II restriction endonuclease [Anaerolineae bacterium]
MNQLDLDDVVQYVEQNIGVFHQKRIQSLDSLRLTQVLKRKNPYLFKAKNLFTPEQFVKSLVDAHISSNEETIFGDWLEQLAIFISVQVHDGWKSGITGIDLEFDADGRRNIVAIKSGPNWGNSSQIAKMILDFKAAQRILRTSNSQLHVVAVNGCCYGKDDKPDKGYYFKFCGQRFWAFISGRNELFTDIIEPVGHRARERNDEFIESYWAMITRFARDFETDFCVDGKIDWVRLVQFNSQATESRIIR